MGEGWQLDNAHLEAEDRKGYVYVRLQGELRTVVEVERAATLMLDRLAQLQSGKLLLDVRGLELPLPDDACHAAWQLIHAKGYEALACALPEDSADLMVTRMNMTGLSTGLPFRAFASIVEAHRWLELKASGIHRRIPSAMMPAVSQPPRTDGSGASVTSVETPGYRPSRITASRKITPPPLTSTVRNATSTSGEMAPSRPPRQSMPSLPATGGSTPPPSVRNGKPNQSDD